jgi:hypothetical protein
MTDPFSSSKYSIEHAKGHIFAFDQAHSLFINSRPYTLVVEQNADGTEDFHKIKMTKPMPPQLAGIAFDAINNMRNALDQACFAVGTAAGGRGRQSHFPFGNDASTVKGKGKGKGKSADLPEEVFDLIVSYQPYSGGNDLLWALNKLCNSQKHEVIIPIGLFNTAIHIDRLEMTNVISMQLPPKWDRSKNEMIVAHLKHGSKFNGNFQVNIFIAFAKIDVVDGQPVLPILHELIGMVESIVMAIEAEARRIRLFS